MKHLKSLTFAVLLAASGALAEVVDRVAAVVNNDIISLSEVEVRAGPELFRVNAIPDPKERGEMRQKVLTAALDSLIGEKLLEGEMRDLSIDVGDTEIDLGIEDVKKQNGMDSAQFEEEIRKAGYTLASYKEFMRKHLRRMKLINLKVRSKMRASDEDLKAEYARWSKLEEQDPEVHARHIVVKMPPKPTEAEVAQARQKAVQIALDARKPGANFAELAKARSEGSSADTGGDLGFFRRGVMMPEFEKAAFTLKPGEVSDPVRTKFGWHVIKVEERRSAAVKTFEEMKDQLRERLLKGQMEKYTDQYVRDLRQAAVVDVKI